MMETFAKDFLKVLLSPLGEVRTDFLLPEGKPKYISVLFTPANVPETYLELEGRSHPTPQNSDDKLPQDLLKGVLTPFGRVQTNVEIPPVPTLIDIWFSPSQNLTVVPQELGMLGKMTTKTDCVIVPFDCQVTTSDIRESVRKLFRLNEEFPSLMNLENISVNKLEDILPRLWVILPSVEDDVLDGFGARQDEAWLRGVYTLGALFLTKIVVVNELPENPDTMWLRMLGSEEIRNKAIDEVISLPKADPRRKSVLELLTTWRMISGKEI